MGINNLNNFLRNNCPNVFRPIHLSEYAYKKVAIDISLFLCKFKSIYGDNWLFAFINLVSCLRRNEIHSVFIYDSGAPPEKMDERAERVKQREKTDQKVSELENLFKKYEETGKLDENLIYFFNTRIKGKDEKNKRLLTPSVVKESIIVDGVDIGLLKAKIEKMRTNVLVISKDDFLLTKKLFDILNIPYYDAPMEAECCCADLCKRGLVDAVMSEDTDVLAYGSPFFLTKIDTYNDVCVELNYQEILKELKFRKEQFLDLCIMCGCDYNKNIFKVGPESSYKLLLKYGNIDNIGEFTDYDLTNLKHIRVRELFLNYEQLQIDSIPYCGIPDFEKLTQFIKENNVVIKNLETLKKSFIQEIEFIEYECDEKEEKLHYVDTKMDIEGNIIEEKEIFISKDDEEAVYVFEEEEEVEI